MDKKEYRKRIIDNKVEEYLKVFGAVCIEGPKWCGKTSTSSVHSKSDIYLADPRGNFQNRKMAQLSPYDILEGEYPKLIDEWQEVPELWDAVRYKVDEANKKGMFILTGSSTPNYKGVLHSGAGRIGIIKMRPMSLYESNDSSGKVSLKELCNGNFKNVLLETPELKKIASLIIRGGWPGNLNATDANSSIVPKSYIDLIVREDTQKIDNVKRDYLKMNLLLRSLARNESTTVSNNTLKNDVFMNENSEINISTISEYLNIFNRLFLLDNQLPYSSKVRSSSKIKQNEKRHFCDPSLACSLLNLTPTKLINDLETFGFMFEALCERDLKIYAESFGAELYHYQDYNNNEIDAVLELSDGSWCAFEIKLGANQIDEAAAKLVKLKKEIENEGGKAPKIVCIICGLSNSAYKREDDVYVVPITALKN